MEEKTAGNTTVAVMLSTAYSVSMEEIPPLEGWYGYATGHIVVHRRTVVYSCAQLCTVVCSCVQLCTVVYSCAQLCAVVYSCVQLCAVGAMLSTASSLRMVWTRCRPLCAGRRRLLHSARMLLCIPMKIGVKSEHCGRAS